MGGAPPRPLAGNPVRGIPVTSVLRGLVVAASLTPLCAEPAIAVLPTLERLIDEIPLADGMGPLVRPWLGGWENVRPQLLDAEPDGDPDLFVFEQLGKLRFYRNEGTPGAPDFVFETDEWGGVHELEFGRVVDVDFDGDLDLFVQAPDFGETSFVPGAYLYTNVGSPSAPVFQNLSSHVDGYLTDDAGQPIGMLTTAPDFVDLEGDGDQDLLFGDVSGAIILYRNVGSASAPSFHFETDRYDSLLIVFGSCNPEVNDPIRLSDLLSHDGLSLRHGYMLLSFFDLDGNDLPDLFLGDQFNSNVYFLRNMGGSPNPSFQCETESFFPPNPDPGYGQFLVATFWDLDSDGDSDTLLGAGNFATSPIVHLLNGGTPTIPAFSIATLDYLPELEVGGRSVPAFADLDGGGVPDFFLGSGSEQRLAFFNNYGTPAVPSFALDDPQFRAIPGASWIGPEFCDIDADGDLDLFTGAGDGAVRWWRNDGTAPPPLFSEVLSDSAFGSSSLRRINSRIDAQAVPRFLDEDADGDFDLVVGPWDFTVEASLVFFRNEGTPQAPRMFFVTDNWKGLGTFGQALAPAFGDLDGDADADLLVGRNDGVVMLFENTGNPAFPAFAGPPEVFEFDVGVGATPFLVDLDADGDRDIAVGESGGGLNLYRASPSGPVPPSFALLAPAVDEAVNGRRDVLFDWEPVTDPASGLECTYELRLAGSPSDPPRTWRIEAGLTDSEATIVLHEGDFRFREHFAWTVVARGVRVAPIPAWRAGTHATWDPIHGDPNLPGRPDPVVRTPPAVAVRARPIPARDTVRLDVAWPSRGVASVDVFDVRGRHVAHVWRGAAEPGERELAWNGRDLSGNRAAAGVYLVRARQGAESATKRVVLLR